MQDAYWPEILKIIIKIDYTVIPCLLKKPLEEIECESNTTKFNINTALINLFLLQFSIQFAGQSN